MMQSRFAMTAQDTDMELSATLDEVLITEQLQSRPPRKIDFQAVERTLLKLARTLGSRPHQVLQLAAESALDLCQVHTVGISILETEGGKDVFRWRGMAGAHAAAIGAAMLRDRSPCGMVLDQNTCLLFAYPELHFPFPGPIDPPIREVLLAPFHDSRGAPVGTIWMVAHDEERKFTAADVQVARELAGFISSALHTLVGLGYVQNVSWTPQPAWDPSAAATG